MPVTRRVLIGSSLASLVPLAGNAAPADDRTIVLEAAKGTLPLETDQAPTQVLAYNGSVPGPLLRFKKGDEVKVRLINKLDQPTSLTWHGMRIDNAMDGVAGLTQKPVQPGESFEYRFTPPDSGLYWYHPHVYPLTPEQQGRGLYGALIVDEANPPVVDADLMLVIADWKLDAKAQIVNDFGALADALRAGRIGQRVSVNSKPVPQSETFAPGARIRLRIVSAVNARVMVISFLGLRPLILAIDGQPCEAFEPVRRSIPIGPGARFDMMFDLPLADDQEASLVLRGDGEPDQPLLAFKVHGDARAALPMIGSLEQNPLLPPVIHLEASRKVDIVIDGGAKSKDAPLPANADPTKLWTLNGFASKGFDTPPLFSVKRGTPVTLGFVNKTGFVQQMHVHGHAMRLLHDLDDGWEPYWRDGVLVPENRAKHVAFIADNPGKWAIECLMLERQVSGLAAWFEVT